MVRTVKSSSFTFQTDISSELVESHTAGILHAFRSSLPSGREEHIFCWIVNSNHIDKAVEHVASKDFDRDSLVFIPYSSKGNWVNKYPHADPALDCSETGEVTVQLNWRPYPNALESMGNETKGHDTDSRAENHVTTQGTSNISYPQLKQAKHSKKRKFGFEETETAHLTNAERDVLHIEIYKYFRWLKDALYQMETVYAGKRVLGNACATSDAIGQALDVLESTFKVISPNINEEAVGEANSSAATASTPFLENTLGEHLSRMVEKAPLRGGSHKREQGDFEHYFQRLLQFKEKNGHSNVPVRYKDDLKLGKWISNIRHKKKSLEAQKLEESPTKAKRDRGIIGAVTLTKERIERFEAVGFSWDLTGPTPRVSWEGRFQQMMEYHQTHGRWPPHSHGTLGEWVHKQRCKWARKDKGFMEKHYPKLQEVGFLWKVKDRQTVSWEDRFQQLVQ
eukprot:CCRYP_004766-RA/>CCRYP_004766-RA protein AED:0.14 eAED:0.14 QI:136/1/1/1/0.75/0.6/5/584/451